jgi:alkylhydroperoxidase domain protein/CMD domain protein
MTTPTTTQTDVLSDLAGITPGSPLAELRAQRPEAAAHAQGSYAALFDPASPGGLSAQERLLVALRVATLHAAAPAIAHYQRRLIDAGAAPDLLTTAESDGANASERLQALLRHADLLGTRPAQARPDDLQALADAGLSTAEIVTLSQIIAFVSFQVRVLAALQLIGGGGEPVTAEAPSAAARAVTSAAQPAPRAIPAQVIRPSANLNRPKAFTVKQLEWSAWLQPLDLADANPKQAAALEGVRGNSPYFRLLAYDIDVLTERTATDRGIFYTPGGAPRADRELSAAATSRLNGCIYCASVHARLAAQLGKRPEDIDRLLLKGVTPGTELQLDDRWQGVVDLAVALAPTPPTATTQHVAHLREIGLSDLEILDIAQAGAFFAWANRLMLTLGEPYFPEEPA